MAIGKSHRIVIEVEPGIKQEIYAALSLKGMTLKDWFLEQAAKSLLQVDHTQKRTDKEE